MHSRFKELAISVGQGWFVVVVGIGLGIYGAIELVAHSKTTGWAWITIGLAVMLAVALNVAYQALRKRDAALAGSGSSESSGGGHPTVFHGGEHNHNHFYSGEEEET